MKNNVDKQYIDLLKYILDNGELKEDRTGTGTLSIFDYSMSFDMSEGFPLLTSKKVHTKSVIHELKWFLEGDTNIKYLVDNGVNIWNGDTFKNFLLKKDNKENIDNKKDFIDKIKSDDDFSKKWGELGPVYGKQWRKWGGVNKKPIAWHHGAISHYKEEKSGDQISDLIETLKNNPDSRRLLVSAWNVGELNKMVLPPCHYAFQCYTRKMNLNDRTIWYNENFNENQLDLSEDFLNDKNVPKRKLDLKWSQRSCDVPLGIPFNIASYAILLHLLSKEVNMVPGKLNFSGGDCHIYTNQIEGVNEQLTRETFKLCKIKLHNKSFFEFTYDDIEISDYESSDIIKFPLSN